jgi:hypothetical protein
MGHSNAVRLKYMTFHSLREMMPELRMSHSSAVRLDGTFHSLREMTPEIFMGHSSAVRLYITFHSLREMIPELINGTLKRRSPYFNKLRY